MAKNVLNLVLFFYFCGILNSTFAESVDLSPSAPEKLVNTYSQCCETGQSLNSTMEACIKIIGLENVTLPTLDDNAFFVDIENIPNEKFVERIGFPNCSARFLMSGRNFNLSTEGILTIEHGNLQHSYSREEYCLEITNAELKSYDAILCAAETIPINSFQEMRLSVIAILLCISGAFLYVTICVHLILWKKQNIHHWLQFAYIAALFCAFMNMAYVQAGARRIWDISCANIIWFATLSHYAVLTSFTWLTSMNFDIWWTIGRSPFRRRNPESHTKLQFLGYSIFSLGIPLIFPIGQYFYSQADNCEGGLKEIAFNYLASTEAQLKYLYGPMAVLLMINVILIYTTMHSLHKETKVIGTGLKFTGSLSRKSKRIQLFLKLLVLMGVTWVFEVTSWLTLTFLEYKNPALVYLFFATDCLNASKGIMIFIVFVCKGNLIKKLNKKLQCNLSNPDTFPRNVTLTKVSSTNTTTSLEAEA